MAEKKNHLLPGSRCVCSDCWSCKISSLGALGCGSRHLWPDVCLTQWVHVSVVSGGRWRRKDRCQEGREEGP